MIRLILMILIEGLIGDNGSKPVRLEKQSKPFKLNPVILVLLFILGVLIFVVLCVLFAPGNESGVYYNSDLVRY